MLRIGRIPYINCYPVYGAIDRGIVPLDGDAGGRCADGAQPHAWRAGDARRLSVVSAVEYARDAERYLLLPELAISCDGPVQSVMLFSRRPAEELDGARVLVSRSVDDQRRTCSSCSSTHVWQARPEFVPGDAELADIARFAEEPHDARLVIGDAALMLQSAAEHRIARAPATRTRTATTWARSGRRGPDCRSSSPSGSRSARTPVHDAAGGARVAARVARLGARAPRRARRPGGASPAASRRRALPSTTFDGLDYRPRPIRTSRG